MAWVANDLQCHHFCYTKALLFPGVLNGQVLLHLINFPNAPPSTMGNAYLEHCLIFWLDTLNQRLIC